MRFNKYIIILFSFIVILSGLIIQNQPPLKPILHIKYINKWPGFKHGDLEMLSEILEEKYNLMPVKFGNDYDIIIDGFFGSTQIKNDKAIKIFYVGEAFEPDTRKYDLSIGFGYNDAKNYVRIPLSYMVKGYMTKNITTKFSRESKCNPNKAYFTCFLNSNGNSKIDGVAARDRLFHRLSLYKRVESGGKHLNNINKPVKNTIEWLSNCKFVIAYENQTFPGYITEKPYQAYLAGAVPLYYGDRSALQDINKNAVIYAGDFNSEEELVNYIIKVDNDDKLYCDTWNQKIVTDKAKEYEAFKQILREKLAAILSINEKNL